MEGVGHPVPARRALVLTAAAVAVCLAAAACGRSGYQYIENGDDTVFVKIPENWEVVSEGVVDYTVTPDGDLQLLPGDSALPWRATFVETPPGAPGSPTGITGAVEIQPVDRRMRGDLNPYRFFGIDLDDTTDGIEVVRHDLVEMDGISGPRLVWKQTNEQGEEMVVDRLVMTDSLNRVVYSVGMGCNSGCYDANVSSIEEVMATFTVRG